LTEGWLRAGDRLALICPCGPPHRQRTREGIKILQSWGLEPVAGPLLQSFLDGGHGSSELSYLAGSDRQRLEDLSWAFKGDFAAIWVVRGGYGMARLLPQLPAFRPKPILGFSDVSVLFQALLRRGWRQLYHCGNVQTLPTLTQGALQATRDLLFRGRLGCLSGQWLQEGRARGPLWGGNLCVLASLAGTSEGLESGPKILFLEDINEAPYRVDRLLTQLEQSGAFEGLRGVALGRFTDCGNLTPVWNHWAPRWNVPVLADLPVGHCSDNYPLQLGVGVELADNQISWLPSSIRSGSGGGSEGSSPAG